MHLELLLEEPSAEEALKHITPKILSGAVSVNFHVFQSKDDSPRAHPTSLCSGTILLNQLPIRLSAYRKWIPDDWRIVVLVNEDRQVPLRGILA